MSRALIALVCWMGGMSLLGLVTALTNIDLSWTTGVSAAGLLAFAFIVAVYARPRTGDEHDATRAGPGSRTAGRRK